MSLYFIFYVLSVSFVVGSSGQRTAIAHLVSQSVNGSILFTETEGGVRVTGLVSGLGDGRYGFHIHELGDTSTCDATGAHFNPDGANHGGREHDERHVGDLGNVQFAGGVAAVDFVDALISLDGRNSVLGRALVLHEQEDDLGLGGHESSLTTGNAGARVACAVIGIQSPADPWNSAGAVYPSLALLTAASVVWLYGM